MARRRAAGDGAVYRRGDGWTGALTLEPDETGKQRRRYVYGKTQREVLDKLHELRRALDDGLPVQTGRGTTVAEYLELWLRDTLGGRVAGGGLRQGTFESYENTVRRHLIPALGRHRLSELKAPHIRAFLTGLRQTHSGRCRCGQCRDGGAGVAKLLSPRTVHLVYAILRLSLADAVRDELISRNPAALVQQGRGEPRKVEPLTADDARRLLAAAQEDRHCVLWLVLLALGLRKGEALALRWPAIDVDAATAQIRASLQRQRTGEVTPSGRRRTQLVEVAPKTAGSERTLALPASLVTALRQHRRDQAAARLAARYWADPDLVFTTRFGAHVDPRAVNWHWARVCARAGIGRHVRVHDLRHASASFLLLQGADLRVVMEQLGHSRMATTSDVYAHVLDEVKHDAATRMDAFLKSIAEA